MLPGFSLTRRLQMDAPRPVIGNDWQPGAGNGVSGKQCADPRLSPGRPPRLSSRRPGLSTRRSVQLSSLSPVSDAGKSPSLAMKPCRHGSEPQLEPANVSSHLLLPGRLMQNTSQVSMQISCRPTARGFLLLNPLMVLPGPRPVSTKTSGMLPTRIVQNKAHHGGSTQYRSIWATLDI